MHSEPTTQALRERADRAGLALAEEALSPLAEYLSLLMQWNRVMNLVGTRTWKDTFDTLIVDSIHLSAFLAQQADLPAEPLCWDLGSGAGLPGIPLRMLWQSGDYWMVEAREKRALFISTVLARIPLPRTHIFRGRVEGFMAGPPPRTADLVISRAFMPWPSLLDLVGQNLRDQGQVILLLRDPVSPAELPPCWKLNRSYAYTAGPVQRYFAALRKLPPHSEKDAQD